MRGGFGMWCVGLCLLFGGAALAQGWTAYSPDGGRYRVDMPAAPKVSTAPIPVGPGQTVPMTAARIVARVPAHEVPFRSGWMASVCSVCATARSTSIRTCPSSSR